MLIDVGKARVSIAVHILSYSPMRSMLVFLFLGLQHPIVSGTMLQVSNHRGYKSTIPGAS